MRGNIQTNLQHGVPVVRATGELDLVTAPTLRQALYAAAQDHGNLVLDLRDASYIESAGLGAILGAKMRLSQKGGQIALVTSPGHVHNMIRLTRLEQAMPVVSTLEEAILAVGGDGSASAGA
jgi:anti-sigma B factor antagonist